MPKAANLATRRHKLGVELFTGSTRYFAVWILAGIVLAAVVPLIVSQWRSIDISAWYIAANVGKYFVAIVAGGYVFTLLPNIVAQGVTRREIATAMGIFGLLWSLVIGVIVIAGFIGEHALYSALDWTQAPRQSDEFHLVLGSFGQTLEFAALYPLSYLLYFTAGALIGAAIYRADGGWLILAPVIPITLAVDDAMSRVDTWGPAWLVQFVSGAFEDRNPWIVVAVALVVIAAGAWGTRRLIIGSPIRAKQA